MGALMDQSRAERILDDVAIEAESIIDLLESVRPADEPEAVEAATLILDNIRAVRAALQKL
jgi:hypothetical protein